MRTASMSHAACASSGGAGDSSLAPRVLTIRRKSGAEFAVLYDPEDAAIASEQAKHDAGKT